MRAMVVYFITIIMSGCASDIRVKNITPEKYIRTQDQTYPLVLNIKDLGFFPSRIRAYAIINNIEYLMEKRGEEFIYQYREPCTQNFSVRYKIVYTEFPTERELIFYKPKFGSYDIAIVPTDGIRINKDEIAFHCNDDAHVRCVSDYVMVENHSNTPLTILDIKITEDHGARGSESANYKKFSAFEFMTNGEKLPKQIDCGATFLFVVFFYHRAETAEGTVTVLTNHPKHNALKIRLLADYKGR